MFRAIRFKGAGPEVLEGADSAVPPRDGEMCRIDLQPPDDASLQLLQQRFGFHPLAIEDCTTSNQRAKVDEYGNHLFLMTHSMSLNDHGRQAIKTVELGAFLGDRYLITIHSEPIPGLDVVWKRATSDPTCGAHGMDFICYLIIDELVDEVFPLVDLVSDQLEDVESAILKRVDSRQLTQLMRLKRWLISMRRVLSPQRDMMAILLRRGDPRISEKTSLYFRDVYDHVVRAYEQIDVERDLLGNAMDAYLSMMANAQHHHHEAVDAARLDIPAADFPDGIFRSELQCAAVRFQIAFLHRTRCMRGASGHNVHLVSPQWLAMIVAPA